MTRVLAVLCALVLGACSESDHKGQDLAACQSEAIKIYPHWRGNMDVGIRATSTYLCMKAKGYGYDEGCLPESGADASAAALPTVSQPARRSSGMRDSRDGWINETSEHCYRKRKLTDFQDRRGHQLGVLFYLSLRLSRSGSLAIFAAIRRA